MVELVVRVVGVVVVVVSVNVSVVPVVDDCVSVDCETVLVVLVKTQSANEPS